MNKNDPNVASVGKFLWDFVVAGTLLTRLPLPHAPQDAFERQAQSGWAFPLIGLLIAALACLCAAVSFGLGFSAGITAGVMLVTSTILTGAMHEDGLADCADGFWGGFDPKRRLEIMKDSQIGTYGVMALFLINGVRWLALTAVISTGFAGVITAAVLSRGVLPALMAKLNHARDAGLSHSVGRPTVQTASIAFGISCLVGLLFVGTGIIGAVIIASLVTVAIARLAQAKIGGQTGDVLGATQIVSETTILLWFAL